MHRLAVGTHPLSRQTVGFAWPHVPCVRNKRGRPRSPRCRPVKDPETPLKPRSLRMRARRKYLAPQVSFHAGVVGNARSIALARMLEDGTSPLNIVCPVRLIGIV